MISRKKKKCKECKEEKYLFGHGLCKECYSVKNNKPLKRTNIEKKPYKINPVSKTQEQRLKKYREKREKYLKDKPFCEARLSGCRLKADQIHHMKGRDGNNLFKHFLGVCDNCHRTIELNPEMAKELNLSISRLKKDEDD